MVMNPSVGSGEWVIRVLDGRIGDYATYRKPGSFNSELEAQGAMQVLQRFGEARSMRVERAEKRNSSIDELADGDLSLTQEQVASIIASIRKTESGEYTLNLAELKKAAGNV